ncbi:MAG: PIG-L family deacetylase [Chloroflexi bacterium]|nr:PIG-L family deacetylase [Chloroflexota bacterium]
MLPLGLADGTQQLRRLLVIGAHSDDIEIGCGGTILRLLAERPHLEVAWMVLSAPGIRRREALASAEALLASAAARQLHVHDFRDGFLPYEGAAVKEQFEALKSFDPDLVLTHYGRDAHQDHRLASELTWNTFRDHLILEYEIPKYDGDLGAPNFFVRLSEDLVKRKITHLLEHFPSQHERRWFTDDLFRALLRLRGMESNAPERYAEAFYARKLTA